MIELLPIRLRVTAALALAMAIVLAGTGLFLYARLGSHLATNLDRELGVRSEDLASVVGRPGSSLTARRGSRFVEHGESYAQLLDANGRVLDATTPLGRTSLLTPAELGAALRDRVFVDRAVVPGLDEPSRLLATEITPRDGTRRVLVVGLTRQDRAEALAGLRAELLIAGPVALLLASLAGYGLAGLSLRPVEAMRRRAASISADTPGGRLPVPPARDELQLLAGTLNEMLARLESALERERDFVADAGHELRTPLALLRTELELALRHAETAEELREAVRRSAQETDRLSQLADDLLLIARSDRGRLELRLEANPVDELFATVLRRFEWRATETATEVRAEGADGVRVRGDRPRLEQALGNLLDNALRYGAGPIRIWCRTGSEGVELHVTDQGAGFPPDYLDRAFERFTRSDTPGSRGGAGLGLSIVRAIAIAHGGSAAARNLAGSGADVWVTVPA